MKMQKQNTAAIIPDYNSNYDGPAMEWEPLNSIDWEPLRLDTNMFHKFAVGPDINHLRQIGPGFSVEPDGQLLVHRFGNNALINLYRFRNRETGGYLTAYLGIDGSYLDFNAPRIEGTGIGLQTFTAIEMYGTEVQYHFLMPYCFSAILYLDGDSGILLQPFDRAKWAAGDYDRPYLIEFAYESLPFIDPSRDHSHD